MSAIKSGDTISISEVWGVGDGVNVKHGDVATWTKTAGFRWYPLEHKYDRRKDLMGVLMRVSTIKVIRIINQFRYKHINHLQQFLFIHLIFLQQTMPYISLTKDDTEQNFKIGYVVDVWHTLQEQLNFTWGGAVEVKILVNISSDYTQDNNLI